MDLRSEIISARCCWTYQFSQMEGAEVCSDVHLRAHFRRPEAIVKTVSIARRCLANNTSVVKRARFAMTRHSNPCTWKLQGHAADWSSGLCPIGVPKPYLESHQSDSDRCDSK